MKETLDLIKILLPKIIFLSLIPTPLKPFLKINHDIGGCQSLPKGN
jgi:hypothetical protein